MDLEASDRVAMGYTLKVVDMIGVAEESDSIRKKRKIIKNEKRCRNGVPKSTQTRKII